MTRGMNGRLIVCAAVLLSAACGCAHEEERRSPPVTAAPATMSPPEQARYNAAQSLRGAARARGEMMRKAHQGG